MKERFLIHLLNRTRDIAMPIIKRIIDSATWPKQFLQRRCIKINKFRRSTVPLIRNLFVLVTKIGKAKLITPVVLDPNDLAHGIHECRFAKGREAHDLVFIAVLTKANVLRQSLIKHSERMREIHPTVDRNVVALAGTPCGAGEITKSINRDNDGFFKWRDVKGGV